MKFHQFSLQVDFFLFVCLTQINHKIKFWDMKWTCKNFRKIMKNYQDIFYYGRIPNKFFSDFIYCLLFFFYFPNIKHPKIQKSGPIIWKSLLIFFPSYIHYETIVQNYLGIILVVYDLFYFLTLNTLKSWKLYSTIWKLVSTFFPDHIHCISVVQKYCQFFLTGWYFLEIVLIQVVK